MKSVIMLAALTVLSIIFTGCNREPSYKVTVDYARNPYNTRNADMTISIELQVAPDDLEYFPAERIDLNRNEKWEEDRYKAPIGYQNTDVIPLTEGDDKRFSFNRLDPSENIFVLRLENGLVDVDDWKAAGQCPFSSVEIKRYIKGDWGRAPVAFPNSMKGDFPCKLKLPVATLRAEGTTIRRSEIVDDTGNDLAWIIKYDGEIVLERFCRDKSQLLDDYEFDLVRDTDRSKPGEYTVVLVEGLPGKKQEVISNEVSVVVPKKQSVPTTGQCAWTRILFGTWKSINNDLVTFEPDGTGLNYHRGDKNNVTPFEWTCLDNGIFKSLSGGSEYRLIFPDNDSYIMNGDRWIRATPPSPKDTNMLEPQEPDPCYWNSLIIGTWSPSWYPDQSTRFMPDGTMIITTKNGKVGSQKWACSEDGELQFIYPNSLSGDYPSSYPIKSIDENSIVMSCWENYRRKDCTWNKVK